jgi:hypothetical protein
VPELLEPWVDWVLYDHREELLCTPDYNNADKIRCNWPTSLDLDIMSGKGSFNQSWRLEYESWIQLPGNEQTWPEQVTINDKPALVLNRHGVPQVKLAAGSYRINGSFVWESMPEFLRINADTALLSLKVNNKTVDFPRLDETGRVWLHARREAATVIEDSLRIQAFRKIDDRTPAWVVLKMNLDVAGSAREVLLSAPFPAENFIPLSLSSSLPARLENDGRLRLQLRPGQWQVTLTARHIGPLTSLKFAEPEDDFRPSREIWVFAKRNNRIVEIAGVTPIDPQQTNLPPDWRNLPAYQLAAGEMMKFKEIKRGDPEPAPDQLSLARNLWLRFDGSGYTIQDHISGAKTSDWRLEMAPPLGLGRVAIDNEEQFITRMTGSENTGVELRSGLVEITADSVYHGTISRIPAVGWVQDFQKVSATLFLPPGYRLIHATGIDNIPTTWLNRWTLLDIFILLIFTIALAKIYSRPIAALGFVTMALLYQEPGAPRWIWLAILIGVALIRTVPDGRFRKSVKIYHGLAFLVLIIIAIPFSVQHLRVGIYPQLEKPGLAMGKLQPPHPAAPIVEHSQLEPEADLFMKSTEKMADMEERTVSRMKGIYSGDSGRGYYQEQQVAQSDPAMISQTGPGIPAWRWNTVGMSWSGPVKHDQKIGLFLLGPTTFMLLAFLRVGLIIVLALSLLGVKYRRTTGWRFPDRKTFLLAALLFLPLLIPARGWATEIPNPGLFEELRERLLEKEDCFPACADIPAMTLDITPGQLDLELSVMAGTKAAIPLPGHPQHWLAGSVKIDNRPATAMYSTGQSLWLMVPAGTHAVSLSGKIPPSNTLQLPLPLKPHRVQINQTGWTTTGVHRDGTIDNQLHFKRIVEQGEQADRLLETGVLPPFVSVERYLRLGLDWRIETTVTRISPPGLAITIEYPLLPGEAVVSGNVRVKNGKGRINLDPQISSVKFHSVLAKNDKLLLKHVQTTDWTETWQVDSSPIFHLEYEGIPVILHQVGNRWTPKWHPWPGEELQLTISRPEGVAGQTVTIDKSRLAISPGSRATDTELDLTLRSSQGGQHSITLPPDSRLQEVRIDNRVQPIRQEKRLVTVPIVPGKQEISLKWRRNSGITASYHTPAIDLGLTGANANIELRLPDNRWPLLVYGPAMGPAILFWSVLLVIVLAAYGLHKSKLTSLNFYQWLLLGIGLSQSNLIGGLLVVGWLIALDFRRKMKPDMDKSTFNLLQVCLAVLTGLAILALLVAISRGLLGHPDMNIVGNGSIRNLLRWYQDYSGEILPRAWLLSVPLFWFRLAMLAWALWISFILLKILRYGWQAFSAPVIWYPTGAAKTAPKEGHGNSEPVEEIDLTEELQVEEDNIDQ